MGAKVPVSKRALLQRINRALAKQDQMVRTARRLDHNLGWYYRVDYMQNFLVEAHVDIEALGRDIGVLREWEDMSE